MTIKKILFIVLALLLFQNFFSQDFRLIDSLQKQYVVVLADTQKVNVLINIAGEYLTEDATNDSVIKYANKALGLSKKINFKLGIAKSYRRIGAGYRKVGEYKKAIAYFTLALNTNKDIDNKFRIKDDYTNIALCYNRQGLYAPTFENLNSALQVAKEMKDDIVIAECLMQIGKVYGEKGEVTQALDKYLKALDLISNSKDTVLIGSTQVMLGNIYSELHDVKNSLLYFNKAKFLFDKSKDKEGLRLMYNCMGLMYQKNGNSKEALLQHEKCLVLAKEIGDYTWVRGCYGNMGNICLSQGDYDKALEYHFGALKISKELNNSTDWSYMCLANDFFAKKNYKLAGAYCDSVFKLKNYTGQIMDAELLASRVDSATGNTNGAYTHYKKYIVLRDKFKNDEVSKAAAKERFQTEYEKQKAEDKAAQDKKDILRKEEAQHEKIVRNSFIVGFTLVLLLAVIIFRGYRQKRRSNEELANKNIEIEEKNKDILDSIRYAKRIQNSLLPTEKYIERVLTNKGKNNK